MANRKSILWIAIALVVGIVIGAGATLGLSRGNLNTATVMNCTADGLVQWATRAYNEGWSYTWGGKSAGSVDSGGLICSYTGGVQNCEAMMRASATSGSIDSLPEVPGIGLYMPGHVGIYIGGGLCIDARSKQVGVTMSAVSAMGWTHWFYIPGISYDSASAQSGGSLCGTVLDTTVTDGWVQIESGGWAYLQDGQALSGWQGNIPGWEGQWFYFDPVTGVAKTGWQNDLPGWEGQWFYFDTVTGTMLNNGWNYIDNQWYYLGPGGTMYRNCTTPDGYTVDANGIWVP